MKFQRAGKKNYAEIPTKSICSDLGFTSKHEVHKLSVLSILNMLHRVKRFGLEGNTIFHKLFKEKDFSAIYGDIRFIKIARKDESKKELQEYEIDEFLRFVNTPRM